MTNENKKQSDKTMEEKSHLDKAKLCMPVSIVDLADKYFGNDCGIDLDLSNRASKRNL